MHDRYPELLSLYCDGDLTAAERADVDAHLEACHECRALLTDLAAITRRAGALEPIEPPRDLWPGIAAAIAAARTTEARVPPAASAPSHAQVLPLRRSPARRSFSFTLPQLAAAAIALIVLSASGAYLFDARRGAGPAPVADATPMPTDAGALLVAHVDMSYEATIEYLERTLDAARDVLDPQTVAVIEQSLATIDAAIADARAAIEADPANAQLVRHLDSTMRRKVDLLRDASRVAART